MFIIMNSSGVIDRAGWADGYGVHVVVKGMQYDPKYHFATTIQFLIHPSASAVECTLVMSLFKEVLPESMLYCINPFNTLTITTDGRTLTR